MRLLFHTALVACLSMVGAIDVHHVASALGHIRGATHNIYHHATRHHGFAFKLGEEFEKMAAGMPRMAQSHGQAKDGALSALTGFAAYEASVVFDGAAVGMAGLGDASEGIQGYFNAMDDVGVTDSVVSGVEDTYDEIKHGRPAPITLALDKARTKKHQDKAQAMHLACAIHLSYWKSDLKFFVDKLTSGFGIFLKVAKNLMLIAWHAAKAIWKAVKKFAAKKLAASKHTALKNALEPLFGSEVDNIDEARIETSTKSLGQRLKEGFKKVGKKIVDGAKALLTLRNLMRALDLVYHVLIEAVFPKTLRDRIGMTATVIAKLLPGKLTKAKSRCMACLLTAPPNAQLSLMRNAFCPDNTDTDECPVTEGTKVCGMEVNSKTGGDLMALVSGDMPEGVDKNDAKELSKALTSFLDEEAAKADTVKDKAYNGLRLALTKTHSFLNSPMTTTYDMVHSKERKKAFGLMEVSDERREMAAGYYASSDWDTHQKFLEMFIKETNRKPIISYERNTHPERYSVAHVASKAAMQERLTQLKSSVAAEKLMTQFAKAFVAKYLHKLDKSESSALDQLVDSEYQASEESVPPPEEDDVQGLVGSK